MWRPQRLSKWLSGRWPFRPATAWDEAVYWALDLETTGLSVADDDVLSVGMLPIRRGVIVWGERYYSLVRPAQLGRLSEETMAVHHILPQELQTAPPLAEVLAEVAERLTPPRENEGRADTALLVHYAPLDVSVLRRDFKAQGLEWPRLVVVDTIKLLLRLDHRRHQLDPYGRPLPRALSEARAHLGLPSYDYHHALVDALATAELFLLLRHRLGLRRLRQAV